MVDKDAGQLISDGLGHQRGGHRRIHTARKRQKRPAGADLLADGTDRRLTVVGHGPASAQLADAVEEVAQNQRSLLGVIDLRMELNAVDFPALVADADRGTGRGVRAQRKAVRHLCHVVAVAHPGDAFFLHAVEQLARGVKPRLRLAVFARGIVLRGGDPAAQRVRNQLTAVADAQNRQAQRENRRIHLRRTLGIDALRATGEDEAGRLQLHQLCKRRGARLYLAVDAGLADTARDQLVILSAEVQNNHTFSSTHLKPRSKIFSR